MSKTEKLKDGKIKKPWLYMQNEVFAIFVILPKVNLALSN